MPRYTVRLAYHRRQEMWADLQIDAPNPKTAARMAAEIDRRDVPWLSKFTVTPVWTKVLTPSPPDSPAKGRGGTRRVPRQTLPPLKCLSDPL